MASSRNAWLYISDFFFILPIVSKNEYVSVSALFRDISGRIMLMVSKPCSWQHLINILIQKLQSDSIVLFYLNVFLLDQKLVMSLDITSKLPASFKYFKNVIVTIFAGFPCNTKSFAIAVLVLFFSFSFSSRFFWTAKTSFNILLPKTVRPRSDLA